MNALLRINSGKTVSDDCYLTGNYPGFVKQISGIIFFGRIRRKLLRGYE